MNERRGAGTAARILPIAPRSSNFFGYGDASGCTLMRITKSGLKGVSNAYPHWSAKGHSSAAENEYCISHLVTVLLRNRTRTQSAGHYASARSSSSHNCTLTLDYLHYSFSPSSRSRCSPSPKTPPSRMDSTSVILILGAGPRLGKTIASKFASGGYKVALAARSLPDGISAEGYLNVRVDLSAPESIPAVFKAVEKSMGIPNIVVYNGLKP